MTARPAILRPARRLVVAASLLLVALSAIGWVRSRWVGDTFEHRRQWPDEDVIRAHFWSFSHGFGDFTLSRIRMDADDPIPGHRAPAATQWRYDRGAPQSVARATVVPTLGIGGYGYVRREFRRKPGRDEQDTCLGQNTPHFAEECDRARMWRIEVENDEFGFLFEGGPPRFRQGSDRMKAMMRREFR